MFKNLADFAGRTICRLYAPAGAALIAGGWFWYHFPHHPRARFLIFTLVVWLCLWLVYFLFKKISYRLLEKSERHPFWQNDFFFFLDELFFIASLLFAVFFIQIEIVSLIYFASALGLLFWRLDKYLALHPETQDWRRVARAFFLLGAFIFIISAVFQYCAYAFYIFDSNLKYYNIVLFRAWAMTMFWLGGFALAGLLYSRAAASGQKSFGQGSRFLIFWTIFFLFALLVGFVNIGVLYNSSLYFNPLVMVQAEMGGWKIFLDSTLVLLALFIFSGIVFLFALRRFFRLVRSAAPRRWRLFNFAVIGLAIFSFLSVASLRNTPEAMILKSFYRYFKGANEKIELSPLIQRKLESFGLKYNTNEFYVNQKEKIFDGQKELIPASLAKQKPNLVIIFAESLSARLTGVYNPRLAGVTPGLEKMATDKNTTVFKNVYNGSTPTITGLIADLCSFYPPTGHDEIETEKRVQRLHLFCLPRALKEAGYASALYVTAVDKSYASKDTIFQSMGVDEIWGTAELAQKIAGKPLSWGYSDHQMFPVFFDELKRREKTGQSFLAMLSTVDNHPPFDLSKDEIPYGDGKNPVLNTVHTADDAFSNFWEDFKNSELSKNTILIVIADHAIFPTAYEKKYFPEEAGKMTFYDELAMLAYVPNSVLPRQVAAYSSSVDLAPTALQLLNINTPNTFEGHSIFGDREKYPNLLGAHEFGLYINQLGQNGQRQTDYVIPNDLKCNNEISSPDGPLTLCEFYQYYQWKRLMFEDGRLWFVETK